MKKFICATIIIWSLFVAGNSFAAFPVSHTVTTGKSATFAEHNISGTHSLQKHKADCFFDKVTRLLHPLNGISHYPNSDGTAGLLSLVFGCIGLLLIPFSIPAIICGIIGLSHGDPFSLAGLLLGICSIILWALYFLLIFTVLL